MHNREDVFKIIPKPQNEDVIIYDKSLEDLLEVDVLTEYNKLILEYQNKTQKINELEEKLNNYKFFIDNLFLYNKSWNENDYIDMIQKEEKVYANFFKEIKKIESNIEVLKKKYKTLNESIEIQKQKEQKEIDKKKQELDDEIDERSEKNFEFKNKIKELKQEKKQIEDNINEINNQINDLKEMKKALNLDHFECPYCGTTVVELNNKKKVFNTIQKNINKNEEEKKKLNLQLKELCNKIEFYEIQFEDNKEILNNNIQFKKENFDFYIKKSVKVLEMEAIRDQTLNEITNFEKQLQDDPRINSQQYKELKDRLNKYKLSLENLRKARIEKEFFLEENKMYQEERIEINKIVEKLTRYKKFLTLFYKIYEKKINDYFGEDFKFKIFKFNDFCLEKIYEIYYKGIEFNFLSQKQKEEFNKKYNEKMATFL